MRIGGALAAGAAITVLALAAPAGGQRAPAVPLPGASPESAAALARGEWPAYAGTYASAKYSPLDQIDAANAKDLRVAWRWASPDHGVRAANSEDPPELPHEGTLLMVGGVLSPSTSLPVCDRRRDRTDAVGVAPAREARHADEPRFNHRVAHRGTAPTSE
jgi:quinoprotein glucose dehydrogenase